MKSAGAASVVFAATLLGIVQTIPAAAEFRTQSVDYKHGDTALEGYLAYDDTISGKRPGVLLLHRRDGMTDLTRKNTEMVAKLGYIAFAPDIFGKAIRPKDVKEMIEQSAIYNKDRPLMRARAQAGFDVLRQNPMVDPARLAMVGYCFGGTVAVELDHKRAELRTSPKDRSVKMETEHHRVIRSGLQSGSRLRHQERRDSFSPSPRCSRPLSG